MADTVLVFTSQLAVEKAIPLDPIALNNLASWLCQEAGHHDGDLYWTGTDAQEERFKAQKAENGGYCDYCRDFAGAILVRFDVRMRSE